MIAIAIYSRPGCHLCEEMQAVVQRAVRASGVAATIEEIDISVDTDLEARYGVDIPVLVVTSEASYHASYDHCTVKYLRQAGVAGTTFMPLAARNVHGNGHMMMLEKNSDEIAAAMLSWLNETVRGGAKTTR